MPAKRLNTENKTETLLIFVDKFAINKLKPKINNADGTKTVPKFNISYFANTNKIPPVKKIIAPITIPALYCF